MIYSRTEPTLIDVGSKKSRGINRQMFLAFRNLCMLKFTYRFAQPPRVFYLHFFVTPPNFRPVGNIGSCTKLFNRKKTGSEGFRRLNKWVWENTDSISHKRDENFWKNALPYLSVFWEMYKKKTERIFIHPFYLKQIKSQRDFRKNGTGAAGAERGPHSLGEGRLPNSPGSHLCTYSRWTKKMELIEDNIQESLYLKLLT